MPTNDPFDADEETARDNQAHKRLQEPDPVGPIPRHIFEMKNNVTRINELIDGMQAVSIARRKIDNSLFEELRERIAKLPLQNT